MRLLVAGVVAIIAACGDNRLPKAPPTLSAGPVTIDVESMTLTLAGSPAMVQKRFLAVRPVDTVIATAYYDPLEGQDRFLPVVEAIGLDGRWLVFADGTRLQLSECAIPRCAILDVDATQVENAVQVRLTLPRAPLEPLYGTGDAAEHVNLVGTVREMSQRQDPDSRSLHNETHVPVPLVIWPRHGAAMLVADDRPGAIDLAKKDETRVTATFNLPERGAYRVYLYTAETPLDLVRTYVALTGRPAVPPRWALAPQGHNAWTSSRELLDAATATRAARIPGSAIWIDDPWETAHGTFVVDELRFQQFDALIADLTALGYNVLLSSAPYVGATESSAADLEEGIAHDYFVTDDSGYPVFWPWQYGPGALVDFTRDGATPWWRERIHRVVMRGAAGFKLDFGEELVPEIAGNRVTFLLAGGDNSTHHNRYAQGYHEAYLGAFPPGEGFVITRAGAWGEQAFNTAIWPGALDGDFRENLVSTTGRRFVGGLPSAISRGLSLSVSGYPFYGSDIGGAREVPSSEVLIRWAQYASLGTIMQLGWDLTRFDAGTDAIYKRSADLHMLLNPLLWTLALQAGRDGTPVTRPAGFVFDCYLCDDALFLLGDDILVAPVVKANATTRNVVFPPGRWIDRATAIEFQGTSSPTSPTVTIQTPLAKIPIWFRAESIVPMFARYADTLLPATAPGVTSYADPAFGSELRLIYTTAHRLGEKPEASTTLHDGASAIAQGATARVTGGTQYTVFTLEVDIRGVAPATPFEMPTAVSADATDLLRVAEVTALESCVTPGCWHLDDKRLLQVRVFAPTGQTRAIVVR